MGSDCQAPRRALGGTLRPAFLGDARVTEGEQRLASGHCAPCRAPQEEALFVSLCQPAYQFLLPEAESMGRMGQRGWAACPPCRHTGGVGAESPHRWKYLGPAKWHVAVRCWRTLY